MSRRDLFLFLLVVICVLYQSVELEAQITNGDDRKFEVGGQFTLLRTPMVTGVNEVVVICTLPCISSST